MGIKGLVLWQAYGIDKAICHATITCGGKTVQTKKIAALDPVFEETFEFEFDDVEKTKFSGAFYMGSEGNEKRVGDEIEFLLTALVKGKPTYKALIVPGGKVDMLATALDFGKDADASGEDVAGLFDALDDDAGGMMMDDDEEED